MAPIDKCHEYFFDIGDIRSFKIFVISGQTLGMIVSQARKTIQKVQIEVDCWRPIIQYGPRLRPNATLRDSTLQPDNFARRETPPGRCLLQRERLPSVIMNSRDRFLETMRYGAPDRVPYFEEGIREDVLRTWRRQGLSPGVNPADLFPSDRREEVLLEVDPRPPLKKWPTCRAELGALRQRLDADDRGRLPAGWKKRVRAWTDRDHVLMVRIHRGFFQTMGVQDWSRFRELIYLLADDPGFVRETMAIQGHFVSRLAEKILAQVQVDAVIFGEPIGGNDRPLLSPAMYEEFVLTGYEPVLEVLRRYEVETIILRTYANARLLIPSVLKWGFNCLWACEVNLEAMDYRHLRREFGRDLRLIGGIDLDALRRGKAAIRREVEEKVPPLLTGGGYVPLADGRVRPDVPFENYVYYRRLLAEVAGQSP
jgi:hypothetical protein